MKYNKIAKFLGLELSVMLYLVKHAINGQISILLQYFVRCDRYQLLVSLPPCNAKFFTTALFD